MRRRVVFANDIDVFAPGRKTDRGTTAFHGNNGGMRRKMPRPLEKSLPNAKRLRMLLRRLDPAEKRVAFQLIKIIRKNPRMRNDEIVSGAYSLLATKGAKMNVMGKKGKTGEKRDLTERDVWMVYIMLNPSKMPSRRA